MGTHRRLRRFLSLFNALNLLIQWNRLWIDSLKLKKINLHSKWKCCSCLTQRVFISLLFFKILISFRNWFCLTRVNIIWVWILSITSKVLKATRSEKWVRLINRSSNKTMMTQNLKPHQLAHLLNQHQA